MAKAHLKLVTPTTVKRTVTPTRLPNRDLRTREYLTEAECRALLARRYCWAGRKVSFLIRKQRVFSHISDRSVW
jgi:hypothetical protein